MQFVNKLLNSLRKKNTPKNKRCNDCVCINKELRVEVLQNLESLQLVVVNLRTYFRQIDSLQNRGLPVNELLVVKVEKLQNRLSELVDKLQSLGVSTTIINEYANKGS